MKRVIRNIAISLLIANLLILVGKDHWLMRYADPLHYLDMLLTFVSVVVVLEYIDRVNTYLNIRYEWTPNTLQRVILQLLMAVTVPAVIAILLTFLQWEFIWHQSLIVNNYFRYEFLPQVLLILIFNLIFILVQQFQNSTSPQTDTTSPVIIAEKGGSKIPVSVPNIACIQLRNGIVYLVTFSGEQMMISENLDHYEKLLGSQHFFRANRQFIINRKACQSFASAENGKVEVVLVPASTSLLVSQKRAASFRAWING